jgi:hypothetical protein
MAMADCNLCVAKCNFVGTRQMTPCDKYEKFDPNKHGCGGSFLSENGWCNADSDYRCLFKTDHESGQIGCDNEVL